MSNKNSDFVASVHKDYLSFIKIASDADIGNFIRAQICQSSCEKLPEMSDMARALFENHNALIIRLEESSRKKSNAGKQGGNPQLKQTDTEINHSLNNDKAEVKQRLSTNAKKPKNNPQIKQTETNADENSNNDKAEVKQCLSTANAEVKPDTVSVSNTVTNTVTDTIRESDADEAAPANSKKIKKQDEKHKHGEYGWVLLSDSEYENLIKNFGADKIKYYISYIDESAQKTKNKNKWSDWNLVIQNAIRDKWGKYDGNTGSFTGPPMRKSASQLIAEAKERGEYNDA